MVQERYQTCICHHVLNKLPYIEFVLFLVFLKRKDILTYDIFIISMLAFNDSNKVPQA